MKKALIKYRLQILATLLLLTTRVGMGAFFISASDITDSNVLSAVNKERTSRNIPALTTNTKLSSAALSKSQDMITRKYFSHVDPDGHYIWDKIVAYGYTPYTILGENLAVDFTSAEGLMSAWIDSPTHRENILNANFKDQGMGIAHGDTSNGEYSVAVTNTFGAQPASVAPTPKPTIKPTPPPAPTPTPKVAAQTQPVPTKTPTPTPTSTPIPSPSPTPTTQTTEQNYPAISSESVLVTPTLSGDAINLNIKVEVTGEIKSVTATAGAQSAQLVPEGNLYSGDLSLPKYYDFQSGNIELTAMSPSGKTDQATIPLKRYQPPVGSNAKNLAFAETSGSPDVYNVYSYVIIIFGALFIVYAIIDTVKSSKKTAEKLLSSGSRITLLLILISTLIFVSWWR